MSLKTLIREKEDLNSEQSIDENTNESAEEDQGNAGWADSIAKVLNTTKPKTKKSIVLSRAKKIKPSESNTKEDFGFEVEGEIKEEKPDKSDLDLKVNVKKNVQLKLRVKPSSNDVERERTLRKIATKGVVQLFNAVRMQQKDLQQQLKDAGPLDSRKEAVLNNIDKRKFLDVLMSGKRSKSEVVDNPIKSETKAENESSDDEDNNKKKSEWDVLRDDFMTNKKIKHWDQEDDEGNSDTKTDNSEDDDDE